MPRDGRWPPDVEVGGRRFGGRAHTRVPSALGSSIYRAAAHSSSTLAPEKVALLTPNQTRTPTHAHASFPTHPTPPTPPHSPPSSASGVHALDPLRVTLATADGFALDDALIAAGVYAELPESRTITFAISAGTTRGHVRRLLRALGNSVQAPPPAVSADPVAPEVDPAGSGDPAAVSHARPPSVGGALLEKAAGSLDPALDPRIPLLEKAAAARDRGLWGGGAVSPREAYFSRRETVPAAKAVGRVSAQLACPYPPGIPVLVPGETISQVRPARARFLSAARSSHRPSAPEAHPDTLASTLHPSPSLHPSTPPHITIGTTPCPSHFVSAAAMASRPTPDRASAHPARRRRSRTAPPLCRRHSTASCGCGTQVAASLVVLTQS